MLRRQDDGCGHRFMCTECSKNDQDHHFHQTGCRSACECRHEFVCWTCKADGSRGVHLTKRNPPFYLKCAQQVSVCVPTFSNSISDGMRESNFGVKHQRFAIRFRPASGASPLSGSALRAKQFITFIHTAFRILKPTTLL